MRTNSGMISKKSEWTFFCQFVALCYHKYLHWAIADHKKGLAVKNGAPEHDGPQNLKDENFGQVQSPSWTVTAGKTLVVPYLSKRQGKPVEDGKDTQSYKRLCDVQ